MPRVVEVEERLDSLHGILLQIHCHFDDFEMDLVPGWVFQNHDILVGESKFSDSLENDLAVVLGLR